MRFIQQLPSQFKDKNSPNSAKAQFMKSVKMGAKNSEPDMQERYNEILKSKMKEVRDKAMQGAKYSFQLQGTDSSQCRTLSKGAQEILGKIAEKAAKREEKRMEKADVVKIRPKAFTGLQGGRIDNNGYIFDSAGQWIMTVDKKTGKIKNRVTGCTMGKYKPDCGYNEHRITELISSLDTTKKAGWYGGTGGHGHTTPAGSIWGSEKPSCGGGNIWGDNTVSSGNIWGTSNKDNNGWW